MVNKLIFKDTEAARDAIMVSQKKEIAKLYGDWADEIGERAKYYSHKREHRRSEFLTMMRG